MFVLGRDRESGSTGSNYQSPQLQSYGQIKREKKKAKTLALITFNLPYLGEEPKGKLLISRVPRADKAECLRQTEQPSSWLQKPCLHESKGCISLQGAKLQWRQAHGLNTSYEIKGSLGSPGALRPR